jgi:hypothetical protein
MRRVAVEIDTRSLVWLRTSPQTFEVFVEPKPNLMEGAITEILYQASFAASQPGATAEPDVVIE